MIFTKRRFLAGLAGMAVVPYRTSWARATADEAPLGQAPLELTATKRLARFRPDGLETPTLQYGTGDPLTVLRLRPGEDRLVRLINGLGEPTSLVWHGPRGPSQSAGGSGTVASLAAGQSKDLHCRFLESGTSWFHPAATALDQTARGLSGVLIVEEAAPPAVDHDLVLFLSDWLLDAQNRPTGDPTATPVIAVNKKADPATWTLRPGSRVRLRSISGSTRRVMVLACEGARPKIVAIDGQPSDLFEPIRGTIPIGPGGRFDYLFDLPTEPGQIVRFTLKGTERRGSILEPDRLVATITTDGRPVEPRSPIAALPPNPALPRQIPLEAAKRADLVIAGTETPGASMAWTVGGIGGVPLPSAPVLKVKQGAPVTLGFTNASSALVPLRVAGQAMRLLHAKDDGWEPYWRDSVLLPPQSRNHVAFVADTPGRWTIESGFDAQALAGLRCWFEVTPA